MAFSGRGAATGALSGAAAGTAMMPGIGTAIGAVGGALLGGAFAPEETTLNTAEMERLAALQHQNDAELRRRSMGVGPSQAQTLLTHASSENAANQLGYAKSLGGDNALANRVASDAIARGQGEAAHQASLLRAQEMEAAMQQYTQSLQAQQAAALGWSNAQAGVDTQNNANQRQWEGQLMQAGASAAGGGMGGAPPQQRPPGWNGGVSYGGSFY